MISPLRNQDCNLIPLTGPQGDSPAWSAGTTLTFSLRDLDPLTDGKLCNSLLGVVVEAYGLWDNQSTAGSTIRKRDFSRILFADAQVENAWHGTPISSNHVKGGTLNPIEWFGSGFNFWNGCGADMATGNATKRLAHGFFLPLQAGSLLKSHHTSLPVALYRNAQVKLTCSATSVLTALSTAAALSGVTIRAYALTIAQPEIVLGPGVEWIRYTYGVTSAAQETVQLDSFGNTSALAGTEPGAGLLNLLWLSNENGQGGCDTVDNVSRVHLPFRGQRPILSPLPFVRRMNLLAGLKVDGSLYAGGVDSYYLPYPYKAGVSTAAQAPYPTVLPLVMSAPEQELSKVQTFGGTQAISIVQTQSSGEHVILAQHVRSWTPEALADAISRLVDAGVVDAVVRSRNVTWVPKFARKNSGDDVSASKQRFMPLKLVPASMAS
jgi:hypothetical protein